MRRAGDRLPGPGLNATHCAQALFADVCTPLLTDSGSLTSSASARPSPRSRRRRRVLYPWSDVGRLMVCPGAR